MSATPPPPPPVRPEVQEKPPAVAWLVPLAGALALIGVFTPWFSPEGSYRGQTVLKAADDLYSWKDGKVGLIAPIVLVVLSVAVVGLLLGRGSRRFDGHAHGPVVGAARAALIAGVVSLVAAVIAWFLVPGQYDDLPANAGGNWDGAEKLGIEMSRGPQVGYILTIAAAVVALIGGALMLATRKKPEPVAGGQFVSQPAAYPPPAPPQGYPQQGPAPKNQAPQNQAPQGGFPPPAGPTA